MQNKYRGYLFFLIVSLWLSNFSAHAYKVGQPSELNNLAEDVRQVVYVSVEDPASIKARVYFWEKSPADAQSTWHLLNNFPIQAVIGKNGLAMEGEKREGDGRTPSGVFALRRAFGYDEDVETGLTYRRVTKRDFWIDDPSSAQYNQWVTGETPQVSHEVLRRDDDVYRYAVVIEYNADPVVPGLGSAIFMHVWRGAGEPTAGCVAMAEDDLVNFLRWLDIRRHPVIILRNSSTGGEND